MSYDPTENTGAVAIQIDEDFASSLSPDITTHTRSSFASINIFYIEEINFITVTSSVAGRLQNYYFTGFGYAGGFIECNAVSSFTTQCDEVCMGVNARSVSLSQVATSSASPPSISGQTTHRLLLRIT
jgi:hypothetical protein